jgi:hypothetical protein
MLKPTGNVISNRFTSTQFSWLLSSKNELVLPLDRTLLGVNMSSIVTIGYYVGKISIPSTTLAALPIRSSAGKKM